MEEHCEETVVSVEAARTSPRPNGPKQNLLYSVNEVPPWYLILPLGFQQVMTALGATLAYPLIVQRSLCLEGDSVGLADVISTVMLVAGIATLIQTSIGIRLPILQSVSFAYIMPVVSLMSSPPWKCPYPYSDPSAMKHLSNLSLPELGSEAHQQLWKARIREVQGAIMMSALVQMVVGFTGIIGFLIRFIGPLTIAPTICLIGLTVFHSAADRASTHWWIAVLMVVLMVIFSQCLGRLRVPCPSWSRQDGFRRTSLPLFSLFPVLLALLMAWAVCSVLTATGVFTSDPEKWGYEARTDAKGTVVQEAHWFRFPYPGQWGRPTLSVAGVLGATAGTLVSMVESLGDYYACARLSGASPPPQSAINRGVGMEGVGSLLAGLWGSIGGSTSYSENISAIGITKVGSRVVVQATGVLLVVLACLGKFGALFVTIPDPVVGGLFFVMFGMVAAAGVSNLQFINLNSLRNLFIFGLSLFTGLGMSSWFGSPAHSQAIQTGSALVDQVFTVLLGTGTFVGGFMGFVLDNLIPGTPEERGLKAIRLGDESEYGEDPTYWMPLCQSKLHRIGFLRYLPFCPGYRGDEEMDTSSRCCSCLSKRQQRPSNNVAMTEADHPLVKGGNCKEVNVRL